MRSRLRVATSVLLALGASALTAFLFLPVEVGPPVSCRSAIVEAWPESVSGGWFNSAPGGDSGFLPPAARASYCGTRSRERLVIPLTVGYVVGLVAVARTVSRAVRRRRVEPDAAG